MPTHSLKGSLLIASPSLTEPTFAKTVILMIEHHEEGAAGLVLNRSTDLQVRDFAKHVFSEPVDWAKEISLGGPVPGPLMVVHTEADFADDSIIEGLMIATEKHRVLECLRLKLEPTIVIANYSGWGPGQLESELAEESWLHIPASLDLIFADHDEEELWDRVMRKVRSAALTRIVGVKSMLRDPSQN